MRLEESKHSLSRERGETVRQLSGNFSKEIKKMILVFGSLIFSIEAKGYWEKKLQGDINELYRFDFNSYLNTKKNAIIFNTFLCIGVNSLNFILEIN